MKSFSRFVCGLAAAGSLMLAGTRAHGAVLLVRYDFESASGSSVPDTSGNNFNGTFAGSGAVSNDAAVGAKSGQMPFLDMPNSTTTPAFSLPTDQMTIDTWVKLPLVSGALPNNIQAVFSNSNGGFTAAGIRLYINDFNTTNGKVVLEEGNGSAGAGMGSNPGAFPSDGAWHNLAVTIDRTAGTAAAYIDGNQVAGSTSMRTDFPVSTPTDEVGIFGDRANFGLHGLVDDFRIYQGQLTQSEIRALVPEPASITLLALGGLSILARRRTRGD